MKEFMLLISSVGDPMKKLSPEQQQQHVHKVRSYIDSLVKKGNWIGGQPLEMQGVNLSGKVGAFIDGPFNESKEVIGGYYHIQAESLEDAVSLAKTDPRFEDGEWRIEIRPIMKVDGLN